MEKSSKLKYILPKNRTVRTVLAVFFWLSAAMCAACIFWLSSNDGNRSQVMSDNVLGFLGKLLGPILNSFIVRKFAHFFEYAALGFVLGCALFLTRRRLQRRLFGERRNPPVFCSGTRLPPFRCRSRCVRSADGYSRARAHSTCCELRRSARKGKIFRVKI